MDQRDPWREAYAAIQSAASPDCPSPERLAALVLGELDADARVKLVDHTLRCRVCSARVKDLMDLRSAAPQERAAGPTGRARRLVGFTRRARAWIKPLTAAAAAVVVLGFWVALREPDSSLPREVDHPRGEVSRTAVALEPTDNARLSAPPRRFVWQAVNGATSYRVDLFDFESTPIWSASNVLTTEARLTDELRASLVPDRPYFWRVTATLGADTLESDTHRFTVAP